MSDFINTDIFINDNDDDDLSDSEIQFRKDFVYNLNLLNLFNNLYNDYIFMERNYNNLKPFFNDLLNDIINLLNSNNLEINLNNIDVNLNNDLKDNLFEIEQETEFLTNMLEEINYRRDLNNLELLSLNLLYNHQNKIWKEINKLGYKLSFFNTLELKEIN